MVLGLVRPAGPPRPSAFHLINKPKDKPDGHPEVKACGWLYIGSHNLSVPGILYASRADRLILLTTIAHRLHGADTAKKTVLSPFPITN